jgi:[protein-PII] uridylyltransferase
LVEVRGVDQIGLLARLSAVFAESGLSVLEARVETLGSSVVDVFMLPAEQISTALREQLDSELAAALSPR